MIPSAQACYQLGVKRKRVTIDILTGEPGSGDFVVQGEERMTPGPGSCRGFFRQGGGMDLEMRLEKIEQLLGLLVKRETVREWYSTEEFARVVGKAEFTVREWCRNGRVNAEKRKSGRGAFPAWAVSHGELLRFRREGLLPVIRTPR